MLLLGLNLMEYEKFGSVAGACLHATRAEQQPAGKTALKSKSQTSVRMPRKATRIARNPGKVAEMTFISPPQKSDSRGFYEV